MYPEYASKYVDAVVLSPHNPNTREKIVHKAENVKVINVFVDSNRSIIENIKKELLKFKPDIVHMFQNPRSLSILMKLRKQFPDSKWVIDFRTPLLSTNYINFKKRQIKFTMCQLFVDEIFTHSINTIKTNMFLIKKPVCELPMGVATNKFVKKENYNDIRKFVFVGVIAKSRKIDFLIDSFEKFSKKHDYAYSLDIIGSGNDIKRIEKIVKRRKMQSVNLLGLLESSDIAKRLSEYDMAIAYVPSGKFNASPSLKSLEYISAGLPVLASNTFGHRDLMNRFGLKFTLFNNKQYNFIKVLDNAVSKENVLDIVDNNLKINYFDWYNLTQNIIIK